jgi:hypothetical protein
MDILSKDWIIINLFNPLLRRGLKSFKKGRLFDLGLFRQRRTHFSYTCQIQKLRMGKTSGIKNSNPQVTVVGLFAIWTSRFHGSSTKVGDYSP